MIRVQTDDFDLGAEYAAFAAGNADVGAIAAFIGRVRANSDGAALRAMTLEHYPGMTEKELERIEAEARKRWPLIDVTIIHRTGRLLPNDQIVLVLTASAHREAAFDAARFLMDFLKTRAPFWKQEETAEGTRWVAAKDADDRAADKWAG